MNLGFGIVTCQKHPQDSEARDSATIFEQAIELAELAELSGLKSLWISEHHFVDDGYLPASFPLLAAMAARTKELRLGTGILLASLMHPLRLAEDIVVTDLISRGRLVLGMGLGWRAEEFDAFELDPKKRVSAMEHRVTLLKEAFRPGTLVGEHRVGIHPKPTKDGGPPILMGGDVKATLERAARIADGVYLSAYGPETLRERLKDMPSDAKPMIVTAQNPVFVWDGPEDPWDVVMEWLPYWAWKMTDMVEARHRAEPAPMPETGPPPERVERYRKGMIIGRPEQVLEKLKEFKGLISPDGDLVARAYYPGMPTEVQHRVVRLLGELARELK